ncbi:hypothetical protein TrCOL_g7036 [Triparma columacea]|uniref:WW domain-containing protein n=1 Tax=Triparma columacea TaxID=722753 RepID=A0A9W7G1X7_9STRA|nr:hypothetical protein TrCOL_g7036 [Triparma columacea]
MNCRKAEVAIGTRIKRSFGPLGVFHGTVTKSRVLGQSLLYYVSYDDGDDEELEECVLLELLNEVNMEGKDESEDGENRVPDSQVGFSSNKISHKPPSYRPPHPSHHVRTDSLNCASDSAKASADSYSTRGGLFKEDDSIGRQTLSDGGEKGKVMRSKHNKNIISGIHNTASVASSSSDEVIVTTLRNNNTEEGEEKWFAYWNAEYNRHYYFNPDTGETTWTMPDNYIEDDCDEGDSDGGEEVRGEDRISTGINGEDGNELRRGIRKGTRDGVGGEDEITGGKGEERVIRRGKGDDVTEEGKGRDRGEVKRRIGENGMEDRNKEDGLGGTERAERERAMVAMKRSKRKIGMYIFLMVMVVVGAVMVGVVTVKDFKGGIIGMEGEGNDNVGLWGVATNSNNNNNNYEGDNKGGKENKGVGEGGNKEVEVGEGREKGKVVKEGKMGGEKNVHEETINDDGKGGKKGTKDGVGRKVNKEDEGMGKGRKKHQGKTKKGKWVFKPGTGVGYVKGGEMGKEEGERRKRERKCKVPFGKFVWGKECEGVRVWEAEELVMLQ